VNELGTAVVPGPPGPVREAVAWARHLEASGFTLLGVADSPSLYPELYATLALVADATSSARVAAWVTNPVLRHPAVVASALATAAELAPGRIVLGVGTGDSALVNVSHPPATLASTAEFVRAVRELLIDGSTTWQGRHVRNANMPSEHIPVLLAASGPRGLALAGELADGAIIAGAIDEASITRSLAGVHRAAVRAGRDPAELEIWWNLKVGVAPSRSEALHAMRYALAARAHYVFRHRVDHAPARYHAALLELVRRYDVGSHGALGRERNGALVTELGLEGFLGSHFAGAGTPDECVARLASLRALGVERVFTMLESRHPAADDAFVSEVLPRLRMLVDRGSADDKETDANTDL
jgi:5,10-methylenetetrahydromethanopterin reductase